MNKTYLFLIVLIFGMIKAALAIGASMIEKIVVNGQAQAVSIAVYKEDTVSFLEAEKLAQALGFALKRHGDLAILCTQAACLPFTIGEQEVREQDGNLFISAAALFTSVGGAWELQENANTLIVDLPDELPANNTAIDVTVGSTAPGFSVIDTDGKTIRLADFLGKKNVVLEFFRSGEW